jgi:hypothetical protein
LPDVLEDLVNCEGGNLTDPFKDDAAELHDHANKKILAQRKKEISWRILMVIISIIVFVAAFLVPLPETMKREYSGKDCEARGGTWNVKRNRCVYD